MTKTTGEVNIVPEERSTIESPAWQTSGIASGMQALSRTDGLPFGARRPGTAVGSSDRYLFLSPDVKEEGVSGLLLKNKRFRDSIERAKNQMRKGGPYLCHNDVFGE